MSFSRPHDARDSLDQPPATALNDEPRKAPHATVEEPSNEAEAELNSGSTASDGLRTSNADCMTPLRGNPRWAFDWEFPPHAADWRPRTRYWSPAAAPARQERRTGMCVSLAPFP